MKRRYILAALANLICGAMIQYEEMTVRVGAELSVTTWRVFLPWQTPRSKPTQTASEGVDIEWTTEVRLVFGLQTEMTSGGICRVYLIRCPEPGTE